jgi:hypothetical protein
MAFKCSLYALIDHGERAILCKMYTFSMIGWLFGMMLAISGIVLPKALG